uniref:Alkyl hydroperoxide reductase subunit C/ Thiol specific antioxidant domain-containing protein n=1 Tax=Erpetoichthys calabaricus TaxID=27687 RepID=A0A8C4X3D5_ERPCA
MLLDEDRKIYHTFGLKRLTKVWSFSSLFLYAEYKASGRPFPHTPLGIQDDIYQFGGDFVLDEQGKVIYFHPSQSTADRPSTEDLLKAICC